MADCGKHGYDRKKIFRLVYAGVLAFTISVLFIILLIWLILHPTKPRFVLKDASVLYLSVTSPNLLNTSLQVTISSRNPNDKIGIYYDKLDAYATYSDQQITARVPLVDPTYQGHNDVDVWSQFLYGNYVPVSPDLATCLTQAPGAGYFDLNVRIDGRIRWKVGTWVSGHYHIYVNCPAVLVSGSYPVNGPVTIRLPQGSECSTEV